MARGRKVKGHFYLARSLGDFFKSLAQPVVVFVTLQVIWLAMTLIWVIWFVDAASQLTRIADKVEISSINDHSAIAVLIVGCVLLLMLLVGTVMLFVISQRQRYLMLQQKSFVSSVTHELRSPLASLQLTLETLRTRQLEPSTIETLQDMASEDIERLSRLVSHILVSSRLDRGIRGIAGNEENVVLDEEIGEVCTNAKWLDSHLEARLVVECPKDLVIYTSKPVIRLILSNLVENAIKYSPRWEAIRVSAKLEHALLTIEVSDQGIGLSHNEQKKIFKMFHRAKVTQKKAIPGTGLGLYIVRSLVRCIGGEVWVESPGKDKGSTFFVTIPANPPV